MDYNFKAIENKWQKQWISDQTYKVEIDKNRPKFYVLDMFPYPSGAGLHVGHPLGYIASDIYSRFKRLNGFNVLHPMGYDAYGLPAEQYAIQTGQHPAVTTEKNLNRYREQLDKIGFCYDWDREIKTCEPSYYHWTQWAFIQMFNSYYCNHAKKALPISNLIQAFNAKGTQGLDVSHTEKMVFTAEQWKAKTDKQQQEILLNYRLAYLADTMVNWCPALGTVLANDEVKEGISVRGGHPVKQKVMRQWLLRVSAYAQRLLDGLDTVDWTESLTEIQRNWIGKSEGAEMKFLVKDSSLEINVFTTRADTVFGVTFMVLAPESELVDALTTPEQREAVDNYILNTNKKTERERQAEVKKVSGVFSGSYAINPLSGEEIPVWIGDYVLAGYGTGAIMAVPAHDSRDFAFARHFNLPILQVVVPEGEEVTEPATWADSKDSKAGTMINSGFLNGLNVKDAIAKTKEFIREKQVGDVQTNYRLRDAIFSRQRYWGEPFPVYYQDGMPQMISEDELPLELPEVDKFLPTEKGEPPLGRAKNWVYKNAYPLELNTMPGFAGSSAYYLRYMDPKNDKALVGKEANEYWQDVDLYIGGTEHATGHLIYSRFWNKFLFDMGYVIKDEPYKKLINQGMIQGRSNFVYRISNDSSLFDLLNDKKAKSFKKIKNCIVIEKTIYAIRENIRPINNIPEGYKVIHITNKKNKKKSISTTSAQTYVSYNVLTSFLKSDISIAYTPIHVDVNIVSNDHLDIDAFRKWNPDNASAEFILEDGKYVCGWAVEKMSKSMFNVVNPDDIIEEYGADTLRLYEMFLGPLEQSKPWNTNGIDGVHKFLRKTWNLFFNEDNNLTLSNEKASKEELKVLHKTIKKVSDDIERFAFNTCVSAFMICVNELNDLNCNKREILEPLIVLLAPFAPHLAEELWHNLGKTTTVCDAQWPVFDEKHLIESTFTYPVSFNGKMRFKLDMPVDASRDMLEQAVKNHRSAQKWLDGKTMRKIIIVPNKIINVVVG